MRFCACSDLVLFVKEERNMYLWILSLSCLIAVSIGQKSQGPAISTANGNLRLKSRGDMIFEVGDSGQLQFMTANGEQMQLGMKGEKGDKGDKGDQGDVGSRGPQGPQGARGSPGFGSGAIIAWNECAWRNLNSGLDYGLIVECRYTKQRNDTWLRLTWNGNMRIWRCTNCCMRWYFTINGEECADPGPLDVIMFQAQNVHILRQSTITGSCRTTGPLTNSTPLDAGPKRIQFSIMDCPGFGGFVYDAYTGFNSVSRIRIEEVIPRDESVPEVAVTPPAGYIFSPHYCQYVYLDLGINNERNLGPIVVNKFQKYHEHTVLKITWEGNFRSDISVFTAVRKTNCINCCSRWWINIDGSECSNYESIETSIRSSTAVNIFVPTTLTGVCYESGDLPISTGAHQITLMVGNCPGSPFTNAASGLFSTSRLIVEEIPRPRDPLVNATAYHPQWSHCAINGIGGLDEGTLEETTCLFNKTSSDSAVKVSFNGNLRITNCEDCCMRWFITINGSECVSPAPIEAVIYSTNARTINVHRGSTIAGICRETSSGVIPSGTLQAQLNVGRCDGFNETFNAFTGLGSVSTINIEELPTPLASAPSDGSYYPNWLQCVTDTPLNSTINDSTIMTCDFSKQLSDSALRVAWDGNIAVIGCDNCCMRWFLTIDGQECSDPGPIDVALRQDLTALNENIWFDDYRPASVVGYCRGNEAGGLLAGRHTIGLAVGGCLNVDDEDITTSEVVTGYNSVSRFIIEEVPNQNQNECTQGQ